MRLYVLFCREGRRLNASYACGRGGQRKVSTVLGQRPDTIISIAARQRIFDVHCRQFVLNGLIRTNRPAKGESLQRIVSRLCQRRFSNTKLLPSKHHRSTICQTFPSTGFNRVVTQYLCLRIIQCQGAVASTAIERHDTLLLHTGLIHWHKAGL